jgi:hypothetical protein
MYKEEKDHNCNERGQRRRLLTILKEKKTITLAQRSIQEKPEMRNVQCLWLSSTLD